jgi:signal transduction histidine kinase
VEAEATRSEAVSAEIQRQWLAAHAGYRAPASVILTAVAIGGLMAVGVQPAAREVLGVAPPLVVAAFGSMLAAFVAAVVSYHAFGVGSRVYRFFDHGETITVQLAALTLVAGSGRGGSCFWLAYLAHASSLPVDPSARRLIQTVVLGSPWLVALYFAIVLHDAPATAFAVCGALAGRFTWNRTQSNKRALARLMAEREQMAEAERKLRAHDERQEIAHALHVGIGAELDALLAMSSELQRGGHPELHDELAAFDTRARTSLDELRGAVWVVDGPTRRWSELVAHLAHTMKDLVADAARLELRAALEDDPRGIPGTHCLALLRILQESVRNAVSHGRARSIVIDMLLEPGRIRATIADDGRGLPDAPPARPGGIANMCARAEHLGGTLSLSAGAGGTTVAVELPLAARPAS